MANRAVMIEVYTLLNLVSNHRRGISQNCHNPAAVLRIKYRTLHIFNILQLNLDRRIIARQDMAMMVYVIEDVKPLT